MSKKLVSLLAIMAVFVLLVGCTGYKVPSYKAPDTKDAFANANTSDTSKKDLGSDDDFDLDDIFEEAGTATADTKKDAKVEYQVANESKDTTKTTTSTTKKTVTKDKTDFKEAAYTPVSTGKVTSTTVGADKTITVIEGSAIKLKLTASDADGDKLTYVFAAPLNRNGEWQTKMGDAGTYDVAVSVSDGKGTTKKTVRIIVEPKNNKPVLRSISDVTVKEGQEVVLNVFATDADGDTLTTTFSGWMDSPKKKTNFNDAGKYSVTVTVSDGIAKVSQDVKITVEDLNQLPTFEIEY